jgi:hypothetical protein
VSGALEDRRPVSSRDISSVMCAKMHPKSRFLSSTPSQHVKSCAFSYLTFCRCVPMTLFPVLIRPVSQCHKLNEGNTRLPRCWGFKKKFRTPWSPVPQPNPTHQIFPKKVSRPPSIECNLTVHFVTAKSTKRAGVRRKLSPFNKFMVRFWAAFVAPSL